MSDDWKFGGFDDPEENWVKLPKAIYENLARFSSEAELKVVLYVLRHTWGYGDDYKAMSVDEICAGRKRKDGTRIDSGTGLQPQAARDGIKRAIEHGFVRVWLDTSDPGRQVKYYMLARHDLDRFPPGVEQLFDAETGGENHPGGGVKITQGGGENHPSYRDRYLDRSSDRNLERTVERGDAPQAPLPASDNANTDPFFGQSRASWYGFGGQRKRAMQNTDAAGRIGLDAPAFAAVVTRLVEIHHLVAIVDAGDDNELRRMQELAVMLAGASFQIDTTEKIDKLYTAWKKQYGKGDVAPYANSLKNYASSLAQQGRLKDGHVIDASGTRAVVAEGARTQAVRAKQRATAAQLPALPSGDVDF